jgi:hypothetical protein
MTSTLYVSRPRVAFAAFACLAGLLTGCGNAAALSGTPKNASTSESGSTSSSNPGSSSSPGSGSGSGPVDAADQKYTEWELKFRSCLSDKGFELPKEPGKIDFGDRQDAYRVVEDACIKKIGKPPTTADDQPAKSDAAAEEQQLKRLQCLRDQGYDVKDPGKGQTPQIQVPEGVSEDGLTKCLNQ